MLDLLRRLPDIEGRHPVFAWDQEDEWYSVVRCGDLVVWREKTGWEVYDCFERIAAALRYKYGPRLEDLVPTQRSLYALFGDSTRANLVVREAREALGRAPEKRRYSLREVAGAIRKGDAETVYGYLAQGGDPTWFDGHAGVGLLHLAAQCRQSLVAWMLLNAGAQVNALDGAGRTPLFCALAEPAGAEGEASTEIIRLLVEAGTFRMSV